MPSLPKGKKKKWIASSKKTTGFTEKHKSENYDFYNSRAWRQLRKWHIEREPHCRWCSRLNQDNLQTLCLPHHNQKTAWAKSKRKRNGKE